MNRGKSLKLSPEQIQHAQDLRASGWTYQAIADECGVSCRCIRYWLDPRQRALKWETQRRDTRKHNKALPPRVRENVEPTNPYRPTEAEVRRAQKLIPPDTRTPAQVAMGEPIFERSALGRMRAEGRVLA